MSDKLRIASTQISLSPILSPIDFWQRIERLFKTAHKAQCHALLLPEYACLSLLTHGYSNEVPFKTRLLNFAKERFRDYESMLFELAHRYELTVVGGTYPVAISDQQIVNRGSIIRPNFPVLFQDKINMTRFESEVWGISRTSQSELQMFEISGVTCAMTICYDVEFPRVTAQAAAAGVELLFVPSCTDDTHSYWRVRHCAHARTIENQCFVALASVIDGDSRFPEMDSHVGQAGILAPCDGRFPERGILAEAKSQSEDIIWVDLDLLELREIRKNGSVLNLRDQTLR